MARFGVIGPYFFREGGRTETVNSQRYVTMLREFLLPQLRRFRIYLTAAWFQQHGATCHTSTESMALLREHFPWHLISKCGDVECPPRFPDLSACDYFLWGYLKAKFYIDKRRTLEAPFRCHNRRNSSDSTCYASKNYGHVFCSSATMLGQ
jgi:hypothetical protein